MSSRQYITRLLTLCLLLQGCNGHQTYAPVIDGWQQGVKGLHQVQKGETLYSIAWSYGYDYRDIAAANNLQSPYPIREGQKLRISKPNKNNKLEKKSRNNIYSGTKAKSVLSNHLSQTKANSVIHWQWPVQGREISGYGFHPQQAPTGNKGIDFAGKEGTAVRAAAAGEVVYSGDGLASYGNLIIIKHSGEYLSAYAHNKKNWVEEGKHVEAGEKIAEMGSSGSHRVLLHFEIRHRGIPVDPHGYLPSK